MIDKESPAICGILLLLLILLTEGDSIMLGKPEHGWTDITVGKEIIGCASYLTDPAMDCLNSFLQYFKEGNVLPFGVEFDAEGYFFGIAEFDKSLYVVSNNAKDGVPVMKEISLETFGLDTFSYSREIVVCLATQCVKDVESELDGWVHWFTYIDGSDENDAVFLQHRKEELENKLLQLKDVLSKLEVFQYVTIAPEEN